MSINESHPDDVQVTGGLLSLVQAIRTAAAYFQAESVMARNLALPAPAPGSYWERCGELFYKTYVEQVKQVGLTSNDTTFRAIVLGQLPAEVLDTKCQDLPTTWVFNPTRREAWRKL